ncbi:MAG: uracil-DNA glycosylase [Proteobacteria bacterium]|jgi:uracil-DNA glycosylase|nr:uracil-DNA glycosylase [Pseudomonadota bacterium]MDA1350763.1 uracil-DNA glycosylase [Pseudomonadota bacterium]|tara:strand:- start:536 stop:1267 length:732 start_codon:yes stop_codon:yes gene_type:complete
MNIIKQAHHQLHRSWVGMLESELDKDYLADLSDFLLQAKALNKVVYPPSEMVFAAFKHTNVDDLKVVILGQDPYHGAGQANGLCFSVAAGNKIPPSLRNIFKELYTDLGIIPASHGCLQSWAQQGVLLLNSVMTVEEGNAGAHAKRGWERFTDQIIRLVSEQTGGVVFMLWGSYAQEKANLIDASRHLILQSAHPSPFSAYRGFFGSKHFSLANDYLMGSGVECIDWQLPAQQDVRGQITLEL